MVVVWCVSVFDACHQLTSVNSLLEEGNHLIQWGILGKVWGTRGRTVSFTCQTEHFSCQRAHCLLTVRRCSSVEEQLSWLDCNGKHKVTKHWVGFFARNVSATMELHVVYDLAIALVCFYWWSSTLVMVRLVQFTTLARDFKPVVILQWIMEYCLIRQGNGAI